jgi:hypothetical protein
MRKVGILLCLLCRLWTVAAAQDSFHIRVHEYEPVPGQLVFEEYTIYVGAGTKSPDGLVAPTNNQLHIAHEFTAGLTPTFSLGAMLLNARRVGGGLEYAGWKVLPHLYAPTTWGFPVNIGIVAEFTVQPKTYADGSGEIEVHPIFEKHFKNLAFVANPSFGRTLSPSGNSQRWTFNPALRRSAYDVSKRLTLGVEYYGQSGRFLSAHSTVDVKVTDNIVWSLGGNVGPDSNDNHVIYTSGLQISLGQRKR